MDGNLGNRLRPLPGGWVLYSSTACHFTAFDARAQCELHNRHRNRHHPPNRLV